jgi:hypothetical protein
METPTPRNRIKRAKEIWKQTGWSLRDCLQAAVDQEISAASDRPSKKAA